MKRLPNSKIAAFAIGQLGWSMMSGLISNWLVYFYQPDAAAQASGPFSSLRGGSFLAFSPSSEPLLPWEESLMQ